MTLFQFGMLAFAFCAFWGIRWFFFTRKKIDRIDAKHRSSKARVGDWGDDWDDRYDIWNK